MKSSIDAVDLVYDILMAEGIDQLITGSIQKYSRDTNSELEDIIINSLPVTGQQIQRGLVNVNIHVPNIRVKINGIDQDKPNVSKLKSLSRAVLDLFEERWEATGDHLFEVDQEVIFPDGSNHYSNIRLSFYAPKT